MNRTHLLAVLTSALTLWTGVARAQCTTPATPCYDGTTFLGIWADNCNTPTILIDAGVFDESRASVLLCSANSRWTIHVTYIIPQITDAPSVLVSGVGGVRSIEEITLGTDNSQMSLLGEIRFGDNIGDVLKVRSGAGIAGLGLDGVIEGDLGDVEASQLNVSVVEEEGYSPFTIIGNILGPIVLDGTHLKGGGAVRDVWVRGDVHGSITVRNGGITRLIVDGAVVAYDEEDEPVPVSIRTTGEIIRLEAGEIVADIVAGDTGIGASGLQNVFALVSTNSGNGTGDFVGSLVAKGLSTGGQIDIRGDLGAGPDREGVITLADPMVFSGGVRIGGSFREDSEINLPSNGLTGTILFNAEDDSGVWESGAVITVGSTPLSQATYTTLPSAVGGGVAGLTDSGFFGAACSPAANSIRSLWPPAYLGDCDDPPTFSGGIAHADLRFRTAVDVDGDSFTVLRTGLGASFNNATDVTTQYEWSYLTGNTSESVIRFSRVGGGDAFLTGYEYRIVPVSGEVRVKHATGTPDVNMTYYQFGVQWSCDLGLLEHFDLNQDEALCSQDIAAWLNDPVDFDGDSVADTMDLGYLVNGVNVWQNR